MHRNVRAILIFVFRLDVGPAVPAERELAAPGARIK
jgi:hypothetical protein